MKDMIHGDRMVAFLIVDGVVYQSDIDHQECLQEYYQKTGQKSPYDWDCDGENADEEHRRAIQQTYAMKQEHTAYGFDLFDADGLGWVLIAHDKQTLDDNIRWAKEYCKENTAKLAYFENGWGAELVAVA